MITAHLFDVLALLTSVFLYVAYLGVTRHQEKIHPLCSIQGVSRKARRDWVASVMTEKNGILAVQTLRNSTMVASFMASTSTLLALGVLSLTAQTDRIAEAWGALGVFGEFEEGALVLKSLVLMLDLFIAFFCFASSIRLYNHVGFMIATGVSEKELPDHIYFVAGHLNRAAHQFRLGMLAFYFMVPLVFWIFGPLYFLVGTISMISLVHVLDKTAGQPEC